MSEKGAADLEQVIRYYDRVAEHYDADRFGNSYGRYIDAQERRVLKRWLAPAGNGLVLDLACGTGRLLDFATHGMDASPEMARIAGQKHPGKALRCGPAAKLGGFGIRFDAIFSLHLLMHLPPAEIQMLLRACFAQLKPGGLLIFDLPSLTRRKLTGFRPAGWHAGTALALQDVMALAGSEWRLLSTRGMLFFPIHRLPEGMRPLVRPLDDVIGASVLKRFSTYVLYCLERK